MDEQHPAFHCCPWVEAKQRPISLSSALTAFATAGAFSAERSATCRQTFLRSAQSPL